MRPNYIPFGYKMCESHLYCQQRPNLEKVGCEQPKPAGLRLAWASWTAHGSGCGLREEELSVQRAWSVGEACLEEEFEADEVDCLPAKQTAWFDTYKVFHILVILCLDHHKL